MEMDSLKVIINDKKGDTTEVNALANLADIYGFINLDSEIAYAQQGLLLAKKLNYIKGEARCYVVLGGAHNSLGNYSQSVSFLLKALHIYEQLRDEDGINAMFMYLQSTYREAGDYHNALVH